MNVLGLKKKELFILTFFFAALILITSVNMLGALQKARDSERKNDIRTIYDALLKYNDEFGFYPQNSEDGKIMACKGEINEEGFPDFRPCEWGEDPLRDIFDESYEPYLKTIPQDPHHKQDVTYYYLSTGKNFQLYAALERRDQDEFDETIFNRNLPCGARLCNFGRANRDVPLDKSLKEYENELEELKNAQNK